MLAAPPAALVDRPRGLFFVVARLPSAPVMFLIELPYSRTMSPHPRDVFAMLWIVSVIHGLVCKYTHLAPAPLPAPATPLPAAVTTAPAAFPTPAAAALVALLIPDDAAPIALVSQLWFCGDCLARFFGGGGTAFFVPTGCDPTGFLIVRAPLGFFVAVAGAMGFLVAAVAGFLYGTVLVWADTGFFACPTALGPVALVPATDFFVPMGCETIFEISGPWNGDE